MKLKVFGIAMVAMMSEMAMASTIIPVWSEAGKDGAIASCQAMNGQVTGIPMETTTAAGTEFYIVACRRPSSNGPTYVPAWSALHFQNARERCATNSVTTGLKAGVAVGTPVYAQSRGTLLSVYICEIQ